MWGNFPWPVTLCWANFERNITHDCKHVATHFDSNVHLFLVESENNEINQKEYASIIRGLIYVTDCIRPDIAYAVGVLCRFTSKPGNEHNIL